MSSGKKWKFAPPSVGTGFSGSKTKRSAVSAEGFDVERTPSPAALLA